MAHALVEVEESTKLGGRNTYEVPRDTISALGAIDGPVAVVSIAGIYRSGKSFLLNCLVGDDAPLFEVGPTINACTRGLWVWPTTLMVPQPDGTSLRVVFVDSEGLGSVGGTQQHDLQIFSLAMLISSLFIYNSVGAIDESSISQLSFVTQLTKHIQVKSGGGGGDELDKFFPDFIWTLRDFTLNLVDEYGNPITEQEYVFPSPMTAAAAARTPIRQYCMPCPTCQTAWTPLPRYLENALMEEPGFTEEIFEKNRVRELVTAFFRRRDCCALMRPAEEESDLNALQSAATAGIRPEFLKQVQSLKQKLLGMLQPKTIRGKVLTGPMLATMIKTYVAAINSGETMTITDAWEAVTVVQGQRAYQESLEHFQGALARDPASGGDHWQLPVAPNTLQAAYDNASAAALRELGHNMLEPDEASVTKLRGEMTAAYRKLCAANDLQMAQKSSALLRQLWSAAKDDHAGGQGGGSNLAGLDTVLLQWRGVQNTFRKKAVDLGLLEAETPAASLEPQLNSFLANAVRKLALRCRCPSGSRCVHLHTVLSARAVCRCCRTRLQQ
jgi:hypothetical protein